MKFIASATSLTALTSILYAHTALAQTYTKCNPTLQSCPPDPALGGTSQVSFASGASSLYSATGNTVSYSSGGAQLAVAASGNNPTLTSSFYLMFGHVDFVIKAAPGVGMVSSAILISDDLDEIDWEILGYQPTEAQTNYFSKGVTGSYNRGGLASVPTSQTAFNTYSIDWTSTQIVWSVNGAPVRTLPYAASGGAYPQSPMQIKVGSWAGGDSTNAQGTIQWAGGPINYAQGPFVMQVQSISATDYSTGRQYQYQGTSGTWQSIVAVDGSVGTGPSSGSVASGSPGSIASSITSTTASSTQSPASSSLPSSWTGVSSSSPVGGTNPIASSTTFSSMTRANSMTSPSTTSGNGSASTADGNSYSPGPSTTVGITPSAVGFVQATSTSLVATSTLTPFNSNAAAQFIPGIGVSAACLTTFMALVFLQ